MREREKGGEKERVSERERKRDVANDLQVD